MKASRRILSFRRALRTLRPARLLSLLSLLCLSLLIGLASNAFAVDQFGALDLPDKPVRGRLLFEEKHCYECHGIAGNGEGLAPDLGRGRFSGQFLDLGAAMWNHVPAMSVRLEAKEISWPEISAEEVVELAAFLYFIEYLGRPGDAVTGQDLFSTKGCARCHSIGEQLAGLGPDLADLDRFASPLYIAQAIWSHGPSMLESMLRIGMSPPTFDDGDLADLSAYIRLLAESGDQERVLLSPGNPNAGRDLFEEKGCMICHAVGGIGGDGGPDLRDSDLHRSAEAIAGTMWNHALEMSRSMREKGIAWPEFTTAELADLISYLYFLSFSDAPGDPVRGQKILNTKSCGSCHATDESVPYPGPELTDSDVATSPGALVAAMWNHAPVMQEAILAEGLPWPELAGDDLRDLLAYLIRSRQVP